MLRSFADRYMNSVFRAPDDEGGAGDAGDTEVLDTGDSGGDDPVDPSEGGDEPAEGSGQPAPKLSVRDEIKKAMAESSNQQGQQPKAAKPKKAETQAAKAAQQNQAAQQQQTPAQGQQSNVPAPERLSKEAKAEWDKTPPAVQQAFLKAEQDMQRGVDELKQKYTLIDQALAPHTDALRQMNATPAEAVNRMFLWFKALAGTPQQAFPALVKSLGLDWNKLVAATTGQATQGEQGQQQGQAQQGAPEIPEPVRNYVGQLENAVRNLSQQMQQMQQGYGNIQQDFQAQNEQKARDNLSIWANGKEFFEEVRQDMAQLLQSGIVPLKNGQVDHDSAYERAIYMNPEVRAKVLAKQQQANQQVQQQAAEQQQTAKQTQVAKAKKAAISLPVSGAPGANSPSQQQQKPKKGLSVRESLKAAMQELRDQ